MVRQKNPITKRSNVSRVPIAHFKSRSIPKSVSVPTSGPQRLSRRQTTPIDKSLRSRHSAQRFNIKSLLTNPTGIEAVWVLNGENSKTNKPISQPTILYHASMDKTLMNAQVGSILSTQGVTWHHTLPSWDFFKGEDRIIAEISIPSYIMRNALSQQRNVFPASHFTQLANKIKAQKQFKEQIHKDLRNRLLDFKTTHQFKTTFTEPMITSFRFKNTSPPLGVRNNKAYATVVMPPFHAKVISKNVSQNPGRVMMQFIGFKKTKQGIQNSTKQFVTKKLHPIARSGLHKKIQLLFKLNNSIVNFSTLRRKLQKQYLNLNINALALPHNISWQHLTYILKELDHAKPPNNVSAHTKILEHMMKHGYSLSSERFVQDLNTIELKIILENLIQSLYDLEHK